MKYYRITFSSKIASINGELFPKTEGSATTCGDKIVSIGIPGSISAISDMAVYECKDIETISVGGVTYRRPDGANEIAIKINGGKKTVIEKINTEVDCTVLPFELSTPLCPEDMASE